ncbi:hypothetical protein [Aquibium oceanicum]|uniref:hypothetical protein n=1 Tax=Aquibium oceanicum TaxID=1670800 RepID=UPI001F42F225|nr:hypothetical protein [Aquibium oceanicum]
MAKSALRNRWDLPYLFVIGRLHRFICHRRGDALLEEKRAQSLRLEEGQLPLVCFLVGDVGLTRGLRDQSELDQSVHQHRAFRIIGHLSELLEYICSAMARSSAVMSWPLTRPTTLESCASATEPSKSDNETIVVPIKMPLFRFLFWSSRS